MVHARRRRARTRGAVVLASNDERDFTDPQQRSRARADAMSAARAHLGRLRQGRHAGAAPAHRDRRRPLLRGDGARPRLLRDRPVRPARGRTAAAPGGAPVDHPLLRRGNRAAPRLRPGGGDGHRARPAQDRPGHAGPRRQDPLQLPALSRGRRRHDSRASSSCSTGRSARPRPSRPPFSLGGLRAWRSSRRFSRRSSPRAGQRNVLFVLIAFPLLIPLLLTAIAATLEATAGRISVDAAAGPPRLRWRRDGGRVYARGGGVGRLRRRRRLTDEDS